MSIKYTERLTEAGLVPSVGSVGDSYDNALAETINGLYKAEAIHRRGPWRSLEAVEYATLEVPESTLDDIAATLAEADASSDGQQPRQPRANRRHEPLFNEDWRAISAAAVSP